MTATIRTMWHTQRHVYQKLHYVALFLFVLNRRCCCRRPRACTALNKDSVHRPLNLSSWALSHDSFMRSWNKWNATAMQRSGSACGREVVLVEWRGPCESVAVENLCSWGVENIKRMLLNNVFSYTLGYIEAVGAKNIKKVMSNFKVEVVQRAPCTHLLIGASA